LVRIYVVMGWAEDAIPADVGERLNPFIGISVLGLKPEDPEQKRSKQITYAFFCPPLLPTMSFVSLRNQHMD
jgi:hypothetical protein